MSDRGHPYARPDRQTSVRNAAQETQGSGVLMGKLKSYFSKTIPWVFQGEAMDTDGTFTQA